LFKRTRKKQRVCNSCIAGFWQALAVKGKFGPLVGELSSLADTPAPAEPVDLTQFVALCEDALPKFKNALDMERVRAERAEDDAQAERMRAASALADAEAERVRADHAENIAAAERRALEEVKAQASSLMEEVEQLRSLRTKAAWTERTKLVAMPERQMQQEAVATPERQVQQELGTEEQIESAARAIAHDMWEANATRCSLCNAKIGKRYFNARHHCRKCGKCVCGPCSPDVIDLENTSTPQRVCKECNPTHSPIIC